MKLPATASPTPPESLPHRHLLLLPHGPHQGTTTTRCGAFRVVVCMCVRARTVPSMIDAFVALVCVEVGVWHRSWALLSIVCCIRATPAKLCPMLCRSVHCSARRSCRRTQLSLVTAYTNSIRAVPNVSAISLLSYTIRIKHCHVLGAGPRGRHKIVLQL